jgi:glycosyltransferase involved in cell wall biosynthesis
LGSIAYRVINRRAANLAKVSVIIPTYNRAQIVGRSIKSALDQTFQDIEILIVDDASTDETLEAVKPFFKHPQVRYLRHEKNKGQQAARNTGIKNSCGEYIAFLDSDDTWIPQKLELQLRAITNRASNCVVLTGMWIITEDGSKTQYLRRYNGYVYPEMLAASGPNFACLLVPVEYLQQIGFLDESATALTDWDTCISLARLYEFITLDELCTIYYANEPDSQTRNKLTRALGYRYIIEKNTNDMLRFVGRRGLARHHLKIALLFDDAGDFSRCKAHIFCAFKTDYITPDRFLLVFSTLFGARVFHFARRKREEIMEKRWKRKQANLTNIIV